MPLPPPPQPSAAPGFPAWYQGGFVDIERLLMDWFAELAPGLTPLTWFPPENEVLENIQAGTIYLRIFRSGGRIVLDEDEQTEVDRTHVQFAAMSASRDLSWEVIEFVRNMLYTFKRGGARMVTPSNYSVITCRGEIVGPTLTPEAFRDWRLVPTTFELDVQRRKGLPSFSKYGAELGLT
jgi:hypothetical protein